MRKIALTIAALLASTGLASAGTCVSAPVATYESAGFSCTLDNVSFSNFVVTTIGSVTLGNFSPFTLGNENGLTLNYTSAATGNNVSSDVDWTYTVTGINGSLISDAFASFVGSISGTGTAVLGEQLLNAMNGTTVGSIDLTAPNTSQTINIVPPVASIDAIKDQQNFSGTLGSALTSSLTNAFSTSPVPGPIVGAGLPGLAAMLFGGGGLWWRRKRKVA